MFMFASKKQEPRRTKKTICRGKLCRTLVTTYERAEDTSPSPSPAGKPTAFPGAPLESMELYLYGRSGAGREGTLSPVRNSMVEGAL